MVSVFWPTRY